MNQPTPAELEAAADQFNRSEKGRQGMKDLLAFLDNGAVAFDYSNQEAVGVILRGAWGGSPCLARDVLRDR